eukprot:m.244976 g.244976  ORF g.244976 m.244976 type:complete len:705 (-) comp54469_c0_seq1:57-2171(-)
MSSGEFKPTADELQRLEAAMKDEQFRKLLVEYAREIQDPANKKLYEEEIRQMEAAQGNNVKFINPEPGFVVKTALLATQMKVFLNICQSDVVEKPSSRTVTRDGKRGTDWSLPHSLSTHREDTDKGSQVCIVYDVVFHSQALRLATMDQRFKQMLVNTAIDAVENRFPEHKLNKQILKFPSMKFKGTQRSTIVRQSHSGEQVVGAPTAMENYAQQFPTVPSQPSPSAPNPVPKAATQPTPQPETPASKFVTPKHTITYRKAFEMQEYRESRDSHDSANIPTAIVVAIDLPLCESAANIDLDITEHALVLHSDTVGPYHLQLSLSYPVSEDDGSAKFDKSKRQLVVTLPVIPPKRPVLPVSAPIISSLDDEDTDSKSESVAANSTEQETAPASTTSSSSEATVVESPTTVAETVSTVDSAPSNSAVQPEEWLVRHTQTQETLTIVVDVAAVAEDSITRLFREREIGSIIAHTCIVNFLSQNDDRPHCIRIDCDAAVVVDKIAISASADNLVIVLTKSSPLLWHRVCITLDDAPRPRELVFLTHETLDSLTESSGVDEWAEHVDSCSAPLTKTVDTPTEVIFHSQQHASAAAVSRVTPAAPASILKTQPTPTPSTSSTTTTATTPAKTTATTTSSSSSTPASPVTTISTATATTPIPTAADVPKVSSESSETGKSVRFQTAETAAPQPVDAAPTWLASTAAVYDLE